MKRPQRIERDRQPGAQPPDPRRPPGDAAHPDSVDRAVVAAIRLQQQGRPDEAAAAFRELQSVAPEHPAVLHFGGLHAHQEGRRDDALQAIRRSLELAPRFPDWWSNFGVVLKAAGRLDEAAEAYARALALDPQHVNALINLGVLARARGRLEEAEGAYRHALRLAPGHAEAYRNLRLLGNAYYVLGRCQRAIEVLESCLRDKPDDPVARHLLAACSGRGVPERAPDAYVLATFDGFAESFDQRLAELGYRAPQLIAEAVARAGLAPDGSLVVLDAGCGTGLCGPLLAPYAARLIGVDLSAAMLDKARGRDAYHELVNRHGYQGIP
jgi:predicted TPR repeat methyltransferase